ncbi:MAG: alpha-L-arabinofuranosidase, partial [Chitinophagales bacterium]
LNSTVSGSLDVLAYASSFTSGQKAVILVNKANSTQSVSVTLKYATPGTRFYFYTLTGGTDNGEFSGKVFVNGNGPTEPSGGPSTIYTSIKPYSSTTQNGIKLTLPARSVVYMVIDKR